jgi:branched-chain amino acid transport system ATP-binding protein
MAMLFEIKNLSVYYGKARALEDISLNIQQGEIVAIVGANGAGKTTLINTISGLKKSASGEIWFKGKRIDRLAPHEVVNTGISQIPAERMIIAPMTVLDNLKMGGLLRKDKHNVARDLQSMFEYFPILKERKSQLGGQLSGGQQQMLAIARALMASPSLLLMDEPSNGLSPILVQEVGKIISDINKRGISILLVEQNCRLALKLSSRAYVLELGKVVLKGVSKELVNDDRIKKSYLGGV